MKAIETKLVKLHPPTQAQMLEIYQQVRALYSSAYGWQARRRSKTSANTPPRRHAAVRPVMD